MLAARIKRKNGQLLAQTLITLSRRRNHSSFFRSNLSNSKGSRAKAFTTRIPVRLSCIVVESVPICS